MVSNGPNLTLLLHRIVFQCLYWRAKIRCNTSYCTSAAPCPRGAPRMSDIEPRHRRIPTQPGSPMATFPTKNRRCVSLQWSLATRLEAVSKRPALELESWSASLPQSSQTLSLSIPVHLCLCEQELGYTYSGQFVCHCHLFLPLGRTFYMTMTKRGQSEASDNLRFYRLCGGATHY